ncbi:hypothetical protein [Zavarzinia sp.]|uniref:hypothetical protein n=1 Tax=Zavarzinia sp. TaxID=2027920 RepID=UPI0035613B84
MAPQVAASGAVAGGAVGYAFGLVEELFNEAADDLFGETDNATADQMLHGSSLESQRPTYVYQLVDPKDVILKYGITSNPIPQSRYSTTQYAAMGARMQLLGVYPTRLQARVEEFGLHAKYFIENGRLPPLSSRF